MENCSEVGQEITCVYGVSFRPVTLLKRDSNTGVHQLEFEYILGTLSHHLLEQGVKYVQS